MTSWNHIFIRSLCGLLGETQGSRLAMAQDKTRDPQLDSRVPAFVTPETISSVGSVGVALPLLLNPRFAAHMLDETTLLSHLEASTSSTQKKSGKNKERAPADKESQSLLAHKPFDPAVSTVSSCALSSGFYKLHYQICTSAVKLLIGSQDTQKLRIGPR